MLSFFKSTKKKSPKKGQSLYHRENLIQTIDELNYVLSHLDSPKNTKSKLNLLFQNKELESIQVKNLVGDFGEESFLLEPDSGIQGHKVYFYRISSEHLKFLIQIQFVEDQFFFAATKVYSESLLSDKDKQNVIKRIIDKYYPDADVNTINFSIEDPKGNILFTHEDIYYYLKYIANNEVSKKLKMQYSGYVKPTSGEEIKDTLDNLI
ncbi:MAG: hypothetical protein HQ521_02000 [Bacteroidetes bacterium]|nr:hypothetical protein [Bacteroidota bacterium]